jgi:hypothetical protein
VCEVTKRPRQLTLFFYCDEYAGYQTLDNEIRMPNTDYTLKEYETILKNFKPFYEEEYFQKE